MTFRVFTAGFKIVYSLHGVGFYRVKITTSQLKILIIHHLVCITKNYIRLKICVMQSSAISGWFFQNFRPKALRIILLLFSRVSLKFFATEFKETPANLNWKTSLHESRFQDLFAPLISIYLLLHYNRYSFLLYSSIFFMLLYGKTS